MKPLPLKNLKSIVPQKFNSLDELENFLKSTETCRLEKNNL